MRLHSIAILAIPTLAASPLYPVRAQELSATASTETVTRSLWGRLDQSARAAMSYDAPTLGAAMQGALSQDASGGWQHEAVVTARAALPTWGGWRLSLAGVSRLGADADTRRLHLADDFGSLDLSYARGTSGAWLGASRARWRSPQGDSGQYAPQAAIGTWRQLGRFLVTFSVDLGAVVGPRSTLRQLSVTDSVPDTLSHGWSYFQRPVTRVDTTNAASRASLAVARIRWTHGPWSLDVAGGQRLSTEGGPARWARGEASMLVDPRVALVFAGGSGGEAFDRLRTCALACSGVADRSYMSLGVRLTAAPFGRSHDVTSPARSAATAFVVRSDGGGRYRFTVEAPFARTVEITGDFTGWSAVRLERIGADSWAVSLPVQPGAHQVNLRLDGDRWTAPPGLTTTTDDLAGTVGIFVAR